MSLIPPILHTARLTLRRPKSDDAPAIARICNHPQLARTLALLPHPYTLDHALDWIATIEKRDDVDGTVSTFLLEKRDDLSVIGSIGLMFGPEDGVASAGYWMDFDHWNQGYATEALRELLRHGFQDRGLQEIRARYMKENQGSGRVMEKAGMAFSHSVPEAWRRDDIVTDEIHYHISATQWRQAHALSPG